ncbi:multidrug efflux SMR transporter [Microbacteriaceae bacterium VKM Ac-2855]|nr:multidrug efflux SMR transporter [Microbacteriaceae bacterium VKM Ac-2855]
MGYLFLAIAIVFEVGGTLSLRMVTSESKRKRLWLLAVLSAYGVAFFGLTMALVEGLPLGVAYGIWTACGVALTTVLSRFLFKEPLTKVMAAGIGLIIVGVLMIELGAAR